MMPFYVKIGYGIAELGIIAVEMIMRLYLLIYYTDTVGLEAKWAGYAVAIAVIWDAITDPLVGILSDRTQSRWGKRRPYIFCGGIFLAISVIAILNPPALDTQAQKFFYLLISYIILNTSMTILSIPHAALGGEITENRDERTELYGWRFLFANLGALLAAVVPNGQIIALTVFITSLLTFATSSKRDLAPPQSTASFLFAIPNTLKNRIFCYLFCSYVVAQIGLAINSTLALYYYNYCLELDESQVQIIIGLFLLVICFSILFWVIVSKKYGKKWPAFIGIFLLGIMTVICYPLFPKKQILPPLFAAVFGGIMVGATALLDSLVADSVDYEVLETGKRREGLYFGIWRMGSKIARAAAIAVCGVWLTYIGFQPNVKQTAIVSRSIAWMFGPGVGSFLLLAAGIFYFVPYRDEDHKAVVEKLHRRE